MPPDFIPHCVGVTAFVVCVTLWFRVVRLEREVTRLQSRVRSNARVDAIIERVDDRVGRGRP